MPKQPLGGRPSKAGPARMKAATVAVSIVAFVGTLGGVASLNSGANAVSVDTQTQPAQTVSSIGLARSSVQTASSVAATSASTTQESSSSAASSVQQAAPVLPLVRTRGS